jgi:hypothetical protein
MKKNHKYLARRNQIPNKTKLGKKFKKFVINCIYIINNSKDD